MVDVVLGVDAGGTKLLAGLVPRDGTVVAVRERATPRADGRCDPGFSAVARLVAELADEARAHGDRVVGVSLGVPEYVREGRLTSAEVFAWDRQPVEVISGIPGLEDLPVTVEADVRCAAAAEASARGSAASFAYVSWGTGLSWTLVEDGRCLSGARGEALALGEWPVDPRSGLVWTGTLEGFASGRGIQSRYAGASGEWLDGAAVEARALGGDVLAASVLGSAGDAVAWAVAGLVQVVDPALVVLGGGVSVRSRLLPERVREGVARVLARRGAPSVEVAVSGEAAGLVGAGLLGWESAGHGGASAAGVRC